MSPTRGVGLARTMVVPQEEVDVVLVIVVNSVIVAVSVETSDQLV